MPHGFKSELLPFLPGILAPGLWLLFPQNAPLLPVSSERTPHQVPQTGACSPAQFLPAHLLLHCLVLPWVAWTHQVTYTGYENPQPDCPLLLPDTAHQNRNRGTGASQTIPSPHVLWALPTGPLADCVGAVPHQLKKSSWFSWNFPRQWSGHYYL